MRDDVSRCAAESVLLGKVGDVGDSAAGDSAGEALRLERAGSAGRGWARGVRLSVYIVRKGRSNVPG